MTPQQAIDHYRTQAAMARALDVTDAAVYLWVKNGFIHYDKQCQIQVETGGKLQASWLDVPEEKRPEGWDQVAA